MNVFGIGLPEMALIMVLALLVFGPKKLPEIGRSMGKAIRGFQEASKEFETEFKREADRLESVPPEPMKADLEMPPALTAAATPVALVNDPSPSPSIVEETEVSEAVATPHQHRPE
ncbi:hypothetical protein DO97_18365 [Neosynechococcus sphagnicola sy1]|uniref:Sec-independent protein translocase protein TatA n=1 Tax=Neosynechococcus sphagnicola sy1 TaxID=1497020 RepID=A0A098TMI3_9CYAN|nr:TatA/E family twin arginine-targeting protein translocase [Neosynechococcus sphagnicola]KGF73481.1 hypothetical protein DO97_18365 [Neosynechococcus sphagnicola sy1]